MHLETPWTGQWLRDLRTSKAWTQAELGARMHPPVRQWQISEWETGAKVPSSATVARMARALRTGARATSLAQARQLAGLSQKELAVMLGVSRPTISGWECGRRGVPTELRPALSQAIGVSVERLEKLIAASKEGPWRGV